MTRQSDKSKFFKLARDRRKQAETSSRYQIRRELDDLAFYAGEQWPSDVKDSRAGMALGNGDNSTQVPARPCITIVGKVRKPVKQVLNQERGSDMGIEIAASDDFGDLSEPVTELEIELREGLTRRIQRASKAADARTWAFMRSTIAGRGVYSVMTRYAPGKTNDQEVYVHRIYNQSAVLGDPSRQQPDGSDAEWWQISENVPWLRYIAEHPQRSDGEKNAVCSYSDDEWRTLGAEQPDWFIGEGDTRSVLVVDYWYVERTSRELLTLSDDSLWWEDEDYPKDIKVANRRTVVEKSIKWAKIDGCDDDVLEETDWLGPDMPIVEILGEELQPFDKETRRCEGMVRAMREPCQGNNAMISKFVEMVAMTPVPTLMMASGQQEGFEEWYKAATTRTLPYLLYNQKDDNDAPAGQPFAPANRDMPIAPVAAGLQMFNEAIQDSSISAPALGEVDGSVKSAKHANVLRDEAAQGTSNYLDNLKRSMEYEAQIINNLLYPVYGTRPGRLARIVNGEGEADHVLIGQPMVMQQGRPVAASTDDQTAKKYTLTKDAQFNIAVKISKNFDTRRQQEASDVGELIGSSPGLLNVFGDLYFKNLDGPGHTEMAERMKVMLDPKVQQLIASKQQGAAIPPEVQAQLAQLQQQNQQLHQAAQQLQQQLQTDAVKEQAESQRAQAKLEADVKMAEMQGQIDLQKAHIDNAARIEIARIGAAKEAANIAAEAAEERLATGLQMQHEVGMAAMGSVAGAQGAASDRAHQAQMTQQGQQHDAQQAAAGQQASSAEAEAARQHEAEMADAARQAATEQAAQQQPAQ